MRMLDDAYAGKFDLIVTREVSKFLARKIKKIDMVTSLKGNE